MGNARTLAALPLCGMLLVGVQTGPAMAAPAYSPDNPFIAGVKPNQRPAGAPVLKEYPKDAAWYAQALHGISEPYPYSLRFLEDQGAWFSPFIHPGMTPPYDIRHWHERKASVQPARVVKPRKRVKRKVKRHRKRKRRIRR